MSEFTVTFRTDNAAFEAAGEVPRILRGIADKVEGGSYEYGTIVDINGNKVGHWHDDIDDGRSCSTPFD